MADAARLTHGRVLRIALPIVLSNATIPLLGAVNTGVIGQLGQAAPIGAVGIGAVILAMLYWVFGFLRMGTSGLAAQAQGAGDLSERAAILQRALGIGLAAGVVFILAQGPLFALAFRIAPASAEVEALARDYLAVRIWGAPATIAMYAVTGWLIALERTRAVLAIQLWINALNVALDLWFVLGLGWGVPGVAAATLVAEWSGLALALWLCRAGLNPARAGGLRRLLDRAQLSRMARVNGDIMLRSVLLQAAFTAFAFLGARAGDVTLAANQVLMQFLEITAYGLDGFAFAAEALVGQAVGARDPRLLRRAAGLTSAWGAGGALVLGLAFLALGPLFIDTIATAPDVRAEARTYLPWLIAAPVLGVASWMLDGIFIGATRTRAMRNSMALSVAAYAGTAALLMPGLGNHGLWAALMVMNVTRALTLGVAFPRLVRAAQA